MRHQAKRQKSQHKKPPAIDSDDEPITKRRPSKLPPSINETALNESSDDDKPLGAKLAQKKASIEKAAAKEAKAIRAEAGPKKATLEEACQG